MPLFELRPLSAGEVLDRTFTLYRSRFLLFAGIAALAAVVRLVGQAGQLGMQRALLVGGPLPRLGLGTTLVSLPMTLLFLLAFTLTQAATVWAMGEVYLGREATVAGSFRATARGWLRYLGIAFWQIGSALWLPLALGLGYAGLFFANGRSFGGFGEGTLLVLGMLAALVGGFLLYLRNLLAVPATVREGLGVRASMRRSKMLADGGKGKLFLVLLIAGALYLGMGILLSTILFAAMFVYHAGHSFLLIQIITLLILFLGYSLISPVVMIGTALVYFDQRVRKEAFDVAVLLGDEPAPASAATAGAEAKAAPGEILAGSAAGEVAVAEPPGGATGL